MTDLPIFVPEDFEILVKKNSAVKTGDVLARRKNLPTEAVIEVSVKLKVSPKKAAKILKKSPGDFVERGEIIAQKDGIFTDTHLISEVSGTVAAFERDSGELIVRLVEEVKDSSESELYSPLDGKITMCDNGKITLATDKNVLLGEAGSGSGAQGMLEILEKKASDEVSADELGGFAVGKVVFAPSFTKDAYAKAAAIDVSGLITLKLTERDIEYLAEKRLNIPVVKVTSAVGRSVAKWAGKEVFIDGQGKTIIPLNYAKNTT